MQAVPCCTMPLRAIPSLTRRPTCDSAGKESTMASQYTPSWPSSRQENAAVRCMYATSRYMDVSMQLSMLNFEKDTLATQYNLEGAAQDLHVYIDSIVKDRVTE